MNTKSNDINERVYKRDNSHDADWKTAPLLLPLGLK